MGTAEHIRLVRPAHVHRELNERRRDYNVAYLGGGGGGPFSGSSYASPVS